MSSARFIDKEDGQELAIAHAQLTAAVRTLADINEPELSITEEIKSEIIKAALNYAKARKTFCGRNLSWLLVERVDADETRKITAYHEAGHFVAAFMCNLEIDKISISSGDFSVSHGKVTYRMGGHANYYQWCDRTLLKEKDAVNQLAIVAYAGYHAQRRLNLETMTNGWEKDIKDAFDLISLNYDKSIGTTQDRLIVLDRKSQDIVCAEWAAIEKLAEALLSAPSSSLLGGEAHDIVLLALSAQAIHRSADCSRCSMFKQG